ncbi:DivIVA domain-containing protein [Micromonospora sp. M51]|uniref:DivIVA domain-containing protein n=1 Tax=Micromonospora parva TaxID=1464048 RepID=A0ABW6VQU2_9ACTN|nr:MULTISPECIES: DivIVA domain-containing protein [Micromonospora]MBQ1010800.1 DivIVA domain-containing protein [Micromonospora sp. M51]MBQ1034318.1 DivIVA domain-containing protein [Micromonospora sp. C97]
MTRGTLYDGTPHGGARLARLHPSQVRDRQFTVVGFGRRGVDPAEVRRFLHRVALDLATLHHDVARLSEENARVKRALRDWQSTWSERRQP